MVFLIQPSGPVARSEVAYRTVRELAERHGTHLDQLCWRPTHVPIDRDLVRLGFRSGIPCEEGLILDGEVVDIKLRRDLLRSPAHRPLHHRAATASDVRLLHALSPAWRRDRGNGDAAARCRVDCEDPYATLEELLAAPPSLALINHWRNLGGACPTPY
jgi:hypothetical protein